MVGMKKNIAKQTQEQEKNDKEYDEVELIFFLVILISYKKQLIQRTWLNHAPNNCLNSTPCINTFNTWAIISVAVANQKVS